MDIDIYTETKIGCKNSFRKKHGRYPTDEEMDFLMKCFGLLPTGDEEKFRYYAELMGSFGLSIARKGVELGPRVTPLPSKRVKTVSRVPLEIPEDYRECFTSQEQ